MSLLQLLSVVLCVLCVLCLPEGDRQTVVVCLMTLWTVNVCLHIESLLWLWTRLSPLWCCHTNISNIASGYTGTCWETHRTCDVSSFWNLFVFTVFKTRGHGLLGSDTSQASGLLCCSTVSQTKGSITYQPHCYLQMFPFCCFYIFSFSRRFIAKHEFNAGTESSSFI